ncbi:MAG: hypothetical protein GC161_07780 [Planctomycetaceae bacterium]|nr:hypothetical protein [Planctomycetaceae bacterium]
MEVKRRSPAPGIWLVALLWVLLLVAAARLARHQADVRVDLTEDQLVSLSPVAKSMLGRLDDVLAVEVYFSGDVEHGSVQLAKRQMLDLVRELERLAGGRMQVVAADPSASAQARLEAERYGLVGEPVTFGRGTARVRQTLYLGFVLRYQGREAVIPFALPQSLEFSFLESLGSLLEPRRKSIGWWAPGAVGDEFAMAREIVARRFDVVDIGSLAGGQPVPPEIDALLVLRPTSLHPRAVHALDQYLVGGGRALWFVDRSLADPAARSLTAVETGLEAYLAHLGTPQGGALLFERGSPGIVRLRSGAGQPLDQPYPYFARIGPDGFDARQPVTQRLPGAEFLWAHPFTMDELPVGLERVPLVQSSAASYAAPPPAELEFDPEALRRAETELLALATPGQEVLVAALTGTWPSPFTGRPAPLARDPLGGPDREVPAAAPRAGAEARLVLVGDADVVSRVGLAQGGLAGLFQENRMLLERLVDWLVLDPELLSLRARLPRNRAIRDFLAEELEAADLSQVQRAVGGSAATPEEEAARARASRREATVTAAAFVGSFAGLAALQLVVWRRRRAPLLVEAAGR